MLRRSNPGRSKRTPAKHPLYDRRLMTRLGPYEVHPAADVFPLLEGAEFDALVQDILVRGLHEPIALTHDGNMIVDGRNRYRACEECGRDPVFYRLSEFFQGKDLIDWIVSVNVKRRHLNPGQLAFVALELEPIYAAEAKERQRAHGGTAPGKPKETLPADRPKVISDARDEAAHAIGGAGRNVSKAKKIEEVAPDLKVEVVSGKTSLDAAYKQAQAIDRNQKEKEPPPSPPSETIILLKTHDNQDVEYKIPKSKSTFNRTNDQVSWAAWTWNPVTGCLHGCRYCYARELALRDSYKPSYPAGFTPLFHHERLDAPKNTTIPPEIAEDDRLGRVFVCSMADLYGKWVPDEWIKKVHAACIESPQWEYLMLTKFPRRYVGLDLPATAWLGTSVDEQKRVRLAEEAFREIKGVRVKWLSLEPLLAPLRFSDLSMFDWIVIGSQSATMQPDGPVPAFAPEFAWVARITAQAHEAGCRVYHKPNLLGIPNSQSAGMKLIQEGPSLAPMKNQYAAE
jgi:protein gp37